MASTADIGWSTVIRFHPVVATAFDPDTTPVDADFGTTDQPLAQIRNFDGLQQEADEIDITNFDSPSATRETIAGMLSSGSATMEMIYSESEAAKFWTATNPLLRLRRWWQIVLPDSSYMIFNGTITAFGITIPVDDVIVCPMTMSVGGAIIFTEV